MTVTHDAVAAIRQLQVLPLGDEGIGFSNQHLGQHPTSAFACDFAQAIIDSIRLTERDDGGISRHGVSLLSGGSGRLDTRLDTPPSIKRRHPDSRLARWSTFMITSCRHWWHCAASDLTPFWRMFGRSIGSIGSLKRERAMSAVEPRGPLTGGCWRE